jgi:peptidoglycan L-alanyl-D-glutamate endopeptidase CwlK
VNGLGSLNYELQPYATGMLQIAMQLSRRAYLASAKRSRSSQAQLYRNYRAGRSRFPAAAPGTSKHERGLAFDLGGLSARQLAHLGRVWRSWGGRWGGSFRRRDPIHFEV